MLAHVDLDAFYASVEELDNPELRGRPIIVGGLAGRGVVSACSYAARAFGVRSAMPIFMARKLCPQAIFLPVRMARYKELSLEVMRILAGFSPMVEQISIDEAFLDLRGTYHMWHGSPHNAANALKQAIKEETGLNCSVGVAPLRFLAKIASERSKPNGLLLVDDMDEFLASIDLKEISGVGKHTLACLHELGLKRLIDIKELNPQFLQKRLGKHGLSLWSLAHGQDPRGVETEREIKSISHELTFNHDLQDTEIICSHLMKLCQKVARRLRSHSRCAGTFTLKLKFPDFTQKTYARTLPLPTDQTLEIFTCMQSLLPPKCNLRLLGVAASCLSQPGQANLFHAQKLHSLYNAEDELYKRFGSRAVTRAVTLLADKHKEY